MRGIHRHCSGGRNMKKRYTRAYVAWRNMKKRCYNKKYLGFKHYGEKGIRVCDEWRYSFLSFLIDMGDPPKGKSLDRIDNSKGYCKENCKWSTPKEQTNNRTNTKRYLYDTHYFTLKEWSHYTGINYNTLCSRVITRGWNIRKAVTTPVKGGQEWRKRRP